MKILYLSSRPPFPKSGGREFMIAQSLGFLVEEKLHVICFHKSDEVFDKEKLLKFCSDKVSFVRIPNIFSFFKNIVFRKGYSLQENLYYSERIQKRINGIISDINPDVVVCDMLRTAQYYEGGAGRLVIDLDDVLSARYNKMRNGYGAFSVLGSYAERLPDIFNRIEPFLRDVILKFEEKKIRVSEERCIKAANSIILTSPAEARELNVTYGIGNCIGIPQVIECDNIVNFNIASDNILFIGNLLTAQNLTSLLYIVESIMPKLKLLLPKSKLLVVGKYDSRAKNIVKACSEIELCGFVNDIGEVSKQCFMSLAVVVFGTGIKTKVLDSMAMGLPVVTNSVGSEGLEIRDGVEVLISDSANEMVDKIISLKDESLSKQLICSAQVYLKKNHSKPLLKKKYLYSLGIKY
jgi:glycosyltransferase involved in cell wall biosynthesis